ncbi:hypothetical protein L6R49_10485 [Myxococcota bacterium]|nr:hypothetical protein [Myxococcota bacterium]
MLRVNHGKVELVFDYHPSAPGLLVAWTSKNWSALVPSGMDPHAVWLRGTGLSVTQAEAVADTWRLRVRPLLNDLDLMAGLIAETLAIAQPCPATRRAQIEELGRLIRAGNLHHVAEALRILERQDRVLIDTTSDHKLVWWVSSPDDVVPASEVAKLRLLSR